MSYIAKDFSTAHYLHKFYIGHKINNFQPTRTLKKVNWSLRVALQIKQDR